MIKIKKCNDDKNKEKNISDKTSQNAINLQKKNEMLINHVLLNYIKKKTKKKLLFVKSMSKKPINRVKNLQ